MPTTTKYTTRLKTKQQDDNSSSLNQPLRIELRIEKLRIEKLRIEKLRIEKLRIEKLRMRIDSSYYNQHCN